MIRRKALSLILSTLVVATALLTGCGTKSPEQGGNNEAATKKLSGEIKIDGSSTVFPISEAIAEEFNKSNPDVKITVGESGTGGGMKKFISKEIDIVDASRPIKKEEADKAKENGVEYIELKVAFDGISLVTNKENTWATDMTVAELNNMWKEGSTVKTWKDIRPEWPAEEIKFYAPGTSSGTFEFFTEAINKKAKSQRTDYTPSEDDNILVQGVAGDKNGIAYFGYSYYEANKAKLNLVKVDGKAPSFDTIKDGSYKPLSRPLYIYVNKSALTKPEVKEFVNFYLNQAKDIVQDVQYVPLPDADYKSQLDLVK
jgi:phosphate transport system substrate-binding protein